MGTLYRLSLYQKILSRKEFCIRIYQENSFYKRHVHQNNIILAKKFTIKKHLKLINFSSQNFVYEKRSWQILKKITQKGIKSPVKHLRWRNKRLNIFNYFHKKLTLDVWLGSKCASVKLNCWIIFHTGQESILPLRYLAFLPMMIRDIFWSRCVYMFCSVSQHRFLYLC